MPKDWECFKAQGPKGPAGFEIYQSTEVERAPLIDFQKKFLIKFEIVQKIKILYLNDYIWQKKCQKGPKNDEKNHKIGL